MTPARSRHVAPIDNEVRLVLQGVAAKPEIVAIAALLSEEDVRADQKAAGELCWKFGNWLRKATHTALSVAEFHSVADAILRAQLYDVVRSARAACRRRRIRRARTRNDPARMYDAEEDDIDAMRESRAVVEDRLGRIDR